MKKITLILLGILFSANTFSQSLKQGFDNLQKGNLEQALKVFDKALNKGTETVAATYGKGCIVSDSNYANFSNIKGFRLIRNANDRFNRLNPKAKEICKTVYGFDQNTIYNKMCQVASRELELIKKENKLDNFQRFVQNYEGADPQVKEAKNYEAEIKWKTLGENADFRSYQSFANDYPESKYAGIATEKYQTIWKEICRKAFEEGEISSINAFEQQYPDYPFYTENDKQRKQLAEYAEKLKFHLNFTEEYIPYYKEYIEKAAPNELAFVALQRLISPYLEWGRFQEAAKVLQDYKPLFPNKAKNIDKISAILNSSSKKYTSTPFPSTVNTDALEYAPVITPDSKTLYFCGYGRKDNVGLEDIFVSNFSNGKWQQAESFEQFNTPIGNEAPLAVSPDGNMLLIYKDANIYYTEKTLRGWTPLRKMESLNTETSWEADASFSADGNAIFFISDRKGNIGNYHKHEKNFHGAFTGNTDIYVCIKQSNGTWGEAINIGSTVNTPFAERSPVLASDMKTLYFSSDGHYGLGKLDVFKCERLSDTSWTMWSEPVNLGKEINTASDDYNYMISTDGTKAYFSKISSSSANICSIDLPKEMRPEIIASVTGKVSDDKGNILPAKIKWEDLETGKLLGNLQCEPSTGRYFITLPSGKNYGYYVEYEGYYPVSGNLNTEKLKEGKNIEHNIIMYSVTDILTGKISIRLSNIFFDTDKYDLKPESYPELKRLSDFIKDNAGIKLEISGHTDNAGSLQHNKTLSQQRSDAVKKYLVSLGCDENSIKSIGYGSEKPVAPNTTEEGKAQNRRVEFKISE
ncbi:MAG: OmpA family protein [Bacteroidales bacterium]|nr:OmpA family protein [Bacteroidales bacterium]